jgi:hypothetical protein
MLTLFCRRCGKEFTARHSTKLYCSTFCRRKYQDERRKDERAEAREQHKLDVLVKEWRADYGLAEFLDQCRKCTYARWDAKAQKKGRSACIMCDACRMA